jgi:hypothetical protein
VNEPSSKFHDIHDDWRQMNEGLWLAESRGKKSVSTLRYGIRCEGIYFITQNPMDDPSGVLAQLGLKIQHAWRAFTANDRQAIKQTADNYPSSE